MLKQPLSGAQRRLWMSGAVGVLVAVVLLGTLFGFLGVLLATPLAATFLVLVKRVYIEDILGGRPKKRPVHEEDSMRKAAAP